jgi:hypothetical protein
MYEMKMPWPNWVMQGALKLSEENLKVVWTKFSTLSLAVLQNVYNSWPVQTRLSLDLKTRPRFCPVSSSLSIGDATQIGLVLFCVKSSKVAKVSTVATT